MKAAVNPAVMKNRLRFITGACMVPDPRKRSTAYPKGEDAFFKVGGRAFGVADGVGSWSTKNVDAGKFSRELMVRAKLFLEEDPSRRDPVQAMVFAEKFAKVHMGSCTFCTVALEDNALKSAVLGDSGFVILRSDHPSNGLLNSAKVCSENCCLAKDRTVNGTWKVVYKSQEQQHAFNTPYQIGTKTNGITAMNSVSVTIPVRQGDIVVCGTDGLFDNLFLNDICQIITRYLDSSGGFKGCIGRSEENQLSDADKIAEFLTDAALAASMHPGKRSPFSTQCVKAGYDAHGGKGDDITTLIAFVTCDRS